MFNIFKKKTVVVRCYTDSRSAFEAFRVERATKYYPKWWSQLEKYKNVSSPTMKGCMGFLELYKKSFLQPLWSDCEIRIKEKKVSYTNELAQDDFELCSPEGNIKYEIHPKNQHTGFCDDDNTVIVKLKSPWRLVCDEDINFMSSDCMYNKDVPGAFSSLSGITTFKYQHNTNIFLSFKKTNLPMFLPVGTPLRFLTPLTERKVIFEYLLDPFVYDSLAGDRISFNNSGYTYMKLLKNRGM